MKTSKHILISVLFGVALISPFTTFSSDEDCNKDLGAFLDCNNPKAISYLSKLGPADVGKVLNGIRLTDGTDVLKGYKYLGKAEGIAKGVHLYVVEFEKHRSAFIWIDKDGTALPIPNCREKVSFESAYVISGDVYTWKAVQPDHGVVHAMCIDDAWAKKAK